MAEQVLSSRRSPVINKRAFIYMFRDGVEVQVGQFEDWGMTNSVNTIQYLECGYTTAMNIPLDYSFGGYLSKGLLNSKLIAMAMKPGDMPADTGAAEIFSSTVRTPYGALPKCTIKLVLQYSDTTNDTGTVDQTGTEAVYEYKNCVLFNHRINNARGIVTESLSFIAETMDMYQQPAVQKRGG